MEPLLQCGVNDVKKNKKYYFIYKGVYRRMMLKKIFLLIK